MKRIKTLISITIFFTAYLSKAQNIKTNNALEKTIESEKILKFNPETNCELRYYYFPNLEAYFDIKKNIYYYKEDGKWEIAEEIPNGYRGYSLYNKSNVIINDYDDENPCQFLSIHKKKYPYATYRKSKQTTVSIE